jgi:hypothetical protein
MKIVYQYFNTETDLPSYHYSKFKYYYDFDDYDLNLFNMGF